MTEQKALELLRTNPLKLLRKISLVPSGSSAGNKTFYISKKDQPRVQLKQAPKYLNQSLLNAEEFRITTNPGFGGVAFDAYSLPMIMKRINNVDDLRTEMNQLPAVGPDIVITGGLSGCSIVTQGNTFAAHIQPYDAKDGLAEKQSGNQLRYVINTFNGFKVFGRQDYGGTNANIIGVRSGGNWRFYAQGKQLRDTARQEIVNVREILAV